MSTEAAGRASFSAIRYAQVWEDADVLLQGLDIQPGDTCLSIASAGDNALAMLTRRPGRLVALDLNPAQLACLELRVAAYQALSWRELLELIGSRESDRRCELYLRCRPLLRDPSRRFWDSRPLEVRDGIGTAGKFERYFRSFREIVLPLIHDRERVDRLLAGGTLEQRRHFYDQEWNSLRWRMLFKFFFSRTVMGRMGRDPAFFQYVQGSVADRIFARAEHALTQLDPFRNPYLQWILTGRHVSALPFALREENFDAIRRGLDRLEWRRCTLEEYLETVPDGSIARLNLSDIFEYMSEANCHALLERISRKMRSGGRMVYWNMLVPRSRPESMSGELRPLEELARDLFLKDKAFFYSRLVIEERA